MLAVRNSYSACKEPWGSRQFILNWRVSTLTSRILLKPGILRWSRTKANSGKVYAASLLDEITQFKLWKMRIIIKIRGKIQMRKTFSKKFCWWEKLIGIRMRLTKTFSARLINPKISTEMPHQVIFLKGFRLIKMTKLNLKKMEMTKEFKRVIWRARMPQ